MSDEYLVDESGQQYEVVSDDGWLTSVFSTLTSGLNAAGAYFNSLPKGQSTLGAGSGQASTTASSGNVWQDLWTGIKNAALQTPAAQNLIQSGAQATAEQKAGQFIMNPVTWIIAGGVFLIALIMIIKKR